jgi:hypothetical protein
MTAQEKTTTIDIGGDTVPIPVVALTCTCGTGMEYEIDDGESAALKCPRCGRCTWIYLDGRIERDE